MGRSNDSPARSSTAGLNAVCRLWFVAPRSVYIKILGWRISLPERIGWVYRGWWWRGEATNGSQGTQNRTPSKARRPARLFSPSIFDPTVSKEDIRAPYFVSRNVDDTRFRVTLFGDIPSDVGHGNFLFSFSWRIVSNKRLTFTLNLFAFLC